MDEYQVVGCETIRHLKVFLVDIDYRNPHIHKELELSLILDGKARVKLHASKIEVSAGDLLLFNSFTSHEISSAQTKPVRILSLMISNQFLQEYTGSLRNLEFETSGENIRDKLSEAVKSDFLAEMFSLARQYFNLKMTDANDATIFLSLGHVCRVIYLLLKHIPNRQIDELSHITRKEKIQRIDRITSYLESNYQGKVRLREIAKQEGVTESHLSHFFRDNIGISFQSYLNNIRFEKAVNLIKNTNLNMLDICLESGFSDVRYLNRMFEERFNCTPKDYRKTLPASHTRTNIVDCDRCDTLSQSVFQPEEAIKLLNQFEAIL